VGVKRSASVVAGMFAVVASTSSPAQNPGADSATRWVDSVFAAYAGWGSPGCAVGVTRRGELVLEKGFGLANLADRTPITPATRFYLASLSKQFTAMSVLLLAQDGKLSLDDDIRKWVHEVPALGGPITLRQLLNHTSGLRDYLTLLGVSGWPADGTLTEAQFLDLVSRQRGLNFAPGTQFLYSNTGYALLSIVVKRASGKTLREFAAERIFHPLQMTSTEFRDDHTIAVAPRAVGYQRVDSAYRASEPQIDVVGDGGVYSTVEDLVKWDANFETGKVGGRAGVALLETPGTASGTDRIPYALGLTVGAYRGLHTVSHSGAYGGYRTAFVRFPDQRLTVITLCNVASAPATLAHQVATIYLGPLMTPQAASIDLQGALSQAPPSQGRAEAGSDDTRRRVDELSRLAGAYYNVDLDLPVTLAVRDGALVMRRASSPDVRFTALSGDVYTSRDQMLLFALRDDAGAVTGFTLTVGRVRDLPFVRR
jgi:CubicO group peptidase (beta-lactamase class C family)